MSDLPPPQEPPEQFPVQPKGHWGFKVLAIVAMVIVVSMFATLGMCSALLMGLSSNTHDSHMGGLLLILYPVGAIVVLGVGIYFIVRN